MPVPLRKLWRANCRYDQLNSCTLHKLSRSIPPGSEMIPCSILQTLKKKGKKKVPTNVKANLVVNLQCSSLTENFFDKRSENYVPRVNYSTMLSARNVYPQSSALREMCICMFILIFNHPLTWDITISVHFSGIMGYFRICIFKI